MVRTRTVWFTCLTLGIMLVAVAVARAALPF